MEETKVVEEEVVEVVPEVTGTETSFEGSTATVTGTEVVSE